MYITGVKPLSVPRLLLTMHNIAMPKCDGNLSYNVKAFLWTPEDIV